jgi:hypothetical protein
VIELSVRGMLPRNRLSRQLLGHLKVYAGPVHPHEAQVNESRKKEDRRKKGLGAPAGRPSAQRSRPKATTVEKAPAIASRRKKAAPAKASTRKKAAPAKPTASKESRA